MTHPSEQDLVLYTTGDAEQMDEVEDHVGDCPECKAHVGELRALLRATRDLPIPEPDAGFEERIWQRQRTQLRSNVAEERTVEITPLPSDSSDRTGASVVRPRFWSLPRIATLGAVAAMLLVAFLAGLYTSPPGTVVVDEESARRAGEDRILLVAVGDHLERTRLVLVELVNAEPEDGSLDISAQQVRAEQLLGDNRLYRQSATLTGEAEVADLLGELERILLEVAHGPGELPAEELQWLRNRIESRDLLFKVKVIEGRTRWDERSSLPSMDAL